MLTPFIEAHLRHPETVDPHVEFRSLGRQFAAEAYGVLEQWESHPSLHLLQGAALLWLFESTGRDDTRIARISAFFIHLYTKAAPRSPKQSGAMIDGEDSSSGWLTNPSLAWGFFLFDK